MVRMIEAEDVVSIRAKEPHVVILDVLAPESYQTRHLPGAINLPEGSPDFEARVQEEIPDQATPVIVYCGSMSCMASTRASEKLERLGYRNVREFKAGLEGWREAGHEFEGETLRMRADVAPAPESEA